MQVILIGTRALSYDLVGKKGKPHSGLVESVCFLCIRKWGKYLLKSRKLLTSFVEMVNTRNRNGSGSKPENENANHNENNNQNQNLEALTTLATQLLDLSANGN
jgi:hypothetical protein